jgi:RasGEF domain
MEHLRELSSFNSLWALGSAINHDTVIRMHRTFAGLPRRHTEVGPLAAVLYPVLVVLSGQRCVRAGMLTLCSSLPSHSFIHIPRHTHIVHICTLTRCGALHHFTRTRSPPSSSPVHLQRLASLNNSISPDHSYRAYRRQLASAKPPCVPFIGMHLSDLSFTENGSSDHIRGRINFFKHYRIYEIVERLLAFQRTPYPFHIVAPLAKLLCSLPSASDAELDTLSALHRR